jgi:hypothetical protein
MAIALFFSWWYGPGWKNSFVRITQRISILSQELSMSILVKTMFEPWKQITSHSNPTDPLELKFRAWFDTLFARMVGFVIRSSVLVFGIITSFFLLIFGTVLAILWPIVPALPIAFIILTIVQL